MGGRGASSSDTTKNVSYESLIKKQQNIQYRFTLQKGIDVDEKGYQIRTLNYKNGLELIRQQKEAIVDVSKGELERRKKQLINLGFTIKEQSKFKKDDSVFQTIKLYIKR